VIGKTISHYRVIEKLGEGGMGMVYLSEDTHLARRVAIKFLSSLDQHYRARFLREARAVSALSHPNIAAVYDYGETEDGQPYLVMELVNGPTLGQLLEDESLTLTRSLQIVASIAAALGEAHQQGVVHLSGSSVIEIGAQVIHVTPPPSRLNPRCGGGDPESDPPTG
jgi:serine/threonine protein kinase